MVCCEFQTVAGWKSLNADQDLGYELTEVCFDLPPAD